MDAPTNATSQMVGEILIDKGLVTIEQVEDCVNAQANGEKRRVGELLVEMKACKIEDVEVSVAEQKGYEIVDLRDFEIPAEILAMVPALICIEHQVVPYSVYDGILTIAFYNVDKPEKIIGTIADLEFICNITVNAVYATKEDVTALLRRYFDPLKEEVDDIFNKKDLVVLTEEDGDADESDKPDSTVQNLARKLIMEAYLRRASDIHLEPFSEHKEKPKVGLLSEVHVADRKKDRIESEVKVAKLRTRFRIDGELQVLEPPIPGSLHGPLVGILKLWTRSMTMQEHRRPQDGAISMSIELDKKTKKRKRLDLRCSVIPTQHGESMVMRLLDRDNLKIGLDGLGMLPEDLKMYQNLIKRPNGIILITGPTGSGKTTTLYSTLMALNKPDVKIITVENPVEYTIPGINQVEIKPQLTFAMALRSILRQAPNIILIGEIRDKETASKAMEASLTGHLVFSTLHTNDAPSAAMRLINMGIRPLLVASNVQAIIAQRLVRILCPDCKKPENDPEKLARLKDFGIMDGACIPGHRPCQKCEGKGYKGRKGIYEIMVMSKELRHLIETKAPTDLLRKQAEKSGMRTLFRDGLAKVAMGSTSFEEMASEAIQYS